MHSETADVGSATYVTYVLDSPKISLIKNFQTGQGIISESFFKIEGVWVKQSSFINRKSHNL